MIEHNNKRPQPEAREMMMKSGNCIWSATVLLAVAAMSALGAGEEVKVIDVDVWGAGGNGGPFEVDPIGFSSSPGGTGLYGAQAGNFVTFCVETNEYLTNGGQYFVQFSKEARAGGSGGPSPDPLDDRTAYLYASFVNDTLQAQLDAWDTDGGTGGTFTYETFASGEALQRAIWYIEEEIGSVSELAASLVDMADWAVGGGIGADFTGAANVRVMNMWANAAFTDPRQDLLVMIPLPAPVWMAGFGLFAVVGRSVVRRRSTEETPLEVTRI